MTGGVTRPHRGRVWLVLLAVIAAGVLLFAVAATRLSSGTTLSTGSVLAVTVAVLLAFAFAELGVVHVPVGRHTYTLTFSDIPLVVGLFFLSPVVLVVVRVLGAAVPRAWENRGSPRKLVFNLAWYTVEASLAVIIWQGVLGGTSELGPTAWLAAALVTVTVDVVGTVVISLVIAADTGTRPRAREVLVEANPFVALVNASTALVIVYVITSDWRALWTVGVVVAVLVFAQRSHNRLRRRTESLERLGRFTGDVGGQLEVESAVRTALHWVTRALNAEVAELVLDERFAGTARSWTASYDGPVTQRAGPARAQSFALWLGDGPLLARRRTRDRALTAALRAAELRDAVAMPLQGDDQVIGTLLVGDRLGDVETFTTSDLRELQALGNHLSVTLRNARRADVIRENAEERLRQSLADELTGLPNRRHVQERLAEHLDTGAPATAVVFDLDRFKDINDTLGHQTGDELLRMVADRLRRSAPADAVVARLGGDEFAVLLLSADEDATAYVVSLVRQALSLPFDLGHLHVTVEATLGVATGTPSEKPSDLLRRADIARFAAKSRRTGVETYRPDMEVASRQRLTLLSDLREAITRGELTVHFQPKVRVRDGQVVGAEALVRWSHPERGFIGPDEFVPVAEHSGLIAPLTFAVLRQSLAACESWRRAGRPLGVAVNISPRSLLDPTFVDEVARALAAVEVPAAAVTLELTESSLMADPERAIEAMQRLRGLGLHLSIDDLGTGYSSLSYLQRLPVSEVKIDRSFLRQDDAGSLAIVGAIVDLGHRLGRSVVAEGVEDEDTWTRLQELGCDTAQGYWMSRPLPAADFQRWLEQWRPSRVAALRSIG